MVKLIVVVREVVSFLLKISQIYRWSFVPTVYFIFLFYLSPVPHTFQFGDSAVGLGESGGFRFYCLFVVFIGTVAD